MKSGSSKKKPVRLTDRDEQLMCHLAEFRMTWLPVIEKIWFQGLTTDAATSNLRRLMKCKPPLIRSRDLYGRHVYYQLTYAGTRRVGVSHRGAQTIGAMAVARQYAFQSFHYLGHGDACSRLTSDQVRKLTSIKGPKSQANFFYLVPGKKKRLGYIVIDYGSTPARFADRILKRLVSLLEHERIRQFVQAKAFEVSILTLTEGKQKSIAQRLKLSGEGILSIRKQKDLFSVPVKLHVIPGLLELIPNAQQ